MSNYPPPQYGGSYHDQGNPPYLPPTYPNQYMQTDNSHAAQSQANATSNYDAYGYNRAIPAFNPVAVPSVSPVPIFQGWNQDSLPLPPYTAPSNTTSYPGYSSAPQHNSPYYPSVNLASYQQPLPTAPRSFDQRELSEGEFDERAATTNTPPVGYGAPQYRGNEGVSYGDNAQRAIYPKPQVYNSRHSPHAGMIS